MPIIELSIFLITIVSFIVTLYVTPLVIRVMKNRNIVGVDINKFTKDKIPEMGGVAVWFGFAAGTMLSIFLFSYLEWIKIDLIPLLAAFSTILMIGFIGLFDDLLEWKKGIRQWQHALLPVFACLPLMAINIQNPAMYIPIIGLIDFGIFYSLILVPVGISGASNATNMLAGLNGLETGLGILLSITLGSITLMTGHTEAAIICFALFGALIAFLKFNWFPAKVFGGDSLTLMVGATIGSAAIIGDLERIGIMLLALFFIEFVIKTKHRFQSECFGIPQLDGTLRANQKGGSLTQWVMRRGKFTEKQVTSIILLIQAIICITVFAISYFKLMYI